MESNAAGLGKGARGGGPGRSLVVLLCTLSFGLWAGEGPKAPPQKTKAAAAHGDCRICHRAHTPGMAKAKAPVAEGKTQSRASAVDTICMDCHQGPSTPTRDQGASKLPTWAGSGSSHVDGPFLDRARTFTKVTDRGDGRKITLRAQCDGCHDVHPRNQSSNLLSLAFDAQGKIQKARPTSVSQVCFGCHAGTDAVRFLKGEGDLGALMGPSAQSAHRPGTTPRSRTDLPSLRSGLFSGTLDCTSCHDNANPNGPRGPHSSPFPNLLKAAYAREGDLGIVGTRGNDLCYSCHERASIEGNQSFAFHAQHLSGFAGVGATRGAKVGQTPKRSGAALLPGLRASGFNAGPGGFGQPTTCATCHDPHGSSKQPALIAFDPAVVAKSSVGSVSFQRTGFRQGTCTLTCHGYDHVQTRY
jgi:hypothetical protein